MRAGQATGTTMDDAHVQYLTTLIASIDSGVLDLTNKDTFLTSAFRSRLSPQERDAIDFSLVNLCDQLRRIVDYFKSTKTPNASPQLQTMIDHLWEMKKRMTEKFGDCLAF